MYTAEQKRAASRKHYSNNKEKHYKLTVAWRSNNHERSKEIGRVYDKKRQNDPHRIETRQAAARRLHHRRKVETLDLYGSKCVFCGEDRYELLTIDHVNNNGAQHRKETNSEKSMWHKLYINYDPTQYQVLCYNCNCAKGFYGIQPGGKTYQSLEVWRSYSKKRNARV